MTGFDYIVVGAGSAGCVLAARLTEDPAVRVLLLEAGGPYRHALLETPLAFLALARDAKIGWGYASEPEPFADGRRIPLPRGRILGGSGAINGMVYSRGHPKDYDDWAALGLPGWSYADVLPYFRRAEASWRGEGPDHGASGPLTVTKIRTDDVVFPAVMAAAAALGYPVVDDHHGGPAEGFARAEVTTHRGHRASTASRYLIPALRRPNLTVETRALVKRVLIEAGRAVGVEYVQDGRVVRAQADGEVVLSGGAFNSPQLLMLSGIGPADALRSARVQPLMDLPDVGRNLQDHPITALAFAARRPVAFEAELRADRLALSMARWFVDGGGPPGQLPITALGFIRTRDGLDRPDVKANLYPTGLTSRVWFPGLRKGSGHVLSAMGVLLRPKSRGEVTLRSADPTAPPLIRLGLLAEPEDRATLRRAVRRLRELFATAPLAGLAAHELSPGADVESDEALDAYHRRVTVTAHHAAGTCAMGTVTDAELKVRGVERLRVVDASIMPRVVGGNTNAPVIMIAEKASDLIRGGA